jgi:hypothetical protein
LQIPKDKSKTKRKETLVKKKCEFPGCQKIFKATAAAIYCKEHRKKIFRKEIDTPKEINKVAKEKVKNEEINLIIQHSSIEALLVERPCDCCGKIYEFVILPRVFVYPRFCELHINEYKRNRYIDQHKNEN